MNFISEAECNPNNAVILHASLYTTIRRTQATMVYSIFAVFEMNEIIVNEIDLYSKIRRNDADLLIPYTITGF